MAIVRCYPAGWDNASGHYSYNTSGTYNETDATIVGQNFSAEALGTSSDYLAWQIPTTKNNTSYVYCLFDFSSIPDNAIIKSVTAKIYAYTYAYSSQTSKISSTNAQFYSGQWESITAKGSAKSMATSTQSGNSAGWLSFTSEEIGEWTRDELDTLRLKLDITIGSSALSTWYPMEIIYAGGTIYVDYDLPIVGDITVGGAKKSLWNGYANIEGVWKKFVKAWYNVDGVWQSYIVPSPSYIRATINVSCSSEPQKITLHNSNGTLVDSWTPSLFDSNTTSCSFTVYDTGTYTVRVYTSSSAYTTKTATITADGEVVSVTVGLTTYTWAKYNANEYYSWSDTGTTVSGSASTDATGYYFGASSLPSSGSFSAYSFSSSSIPSYIALQGNNPWVSTSGGSCSATSAAYTKKASVSELGEITLTDCPKWTATKTYSQGSYIEDVTSTNASAYPDNGRSGSYWYVKK